MFIPSLLNKTYYSFLSSSLSIEEIVDHSFAHDHKYAVISDFENSHGWHKFATYAKKRGLIAVFGLQLNHLNSSILLLAKNKEGYRRLLKLSNTKDIKVLDNFDHLIFIHLDGEDYFPDVDKYVANSDQPNGVYIRENKFLKKEDFEFYCLLRAIHNNTTLEKEIELNEAYRNDYLEYEVDESLLDSHKVKNLHSILEQCVEYEFLDKYNTLDFYEDAPSILKKLIDESFEKCLFPKEQRAQYEERLNEELKVIIKKGFCEYFLIVWDAVSWAKNNSIYVGPGRGSVCGSLIAYVLGITEIDPIKYGLYFERFLNPTRHTIPDIDIDVASDKREKLFAYLQDKYGKDHVASIAVYKTFRAKNSVRDVCRAYGVSSDMADACLKSINQNDAIDFNSPTFQNLNSNFPSLIRSLEKIQNFPINLSIHAAGVVISSESIPEVIPVTQSSSELLSTQWTANEIKNFGFVKFDFLSLHYLFVLNNMEEKIRNKGIKLDWNEISLDDPKVYDTLNQGKNVFIFQFEHPKIKKLIQSFKPSSLLDLALLSSINRPGASDQIPTLLARKSLRNSSQCQQEGLNFLKSQGSNNPLFRNFDDTFGLLIYQEQLMSLVMEVTNCSAGEADSFRRRLSDKSQEFFSQQWFFQQAQEQFSNSNLQDLWEVISKFANYSFNKSHAVAYSVISYRLLWIKTYYPDVFYTELLSSSINTDYFFEIEESGFSISAPTYGKSSYDVFTFFEGTFYFPISAISGIASTLTKEKYEKLEQNSSTATDAIHDCIRADMKLDEITLLLRAGYFKTLFSPEESEAFFEQNLQIIYDNYAYKRDGGQSIFERKPKPVIQTEEDKEKYANYQRELLGFQLNKARVNSKVFQKYKSLSKLNTITNQTNNPSKYIGFLHDVREAKTFRDSEFVWLILCDGFFVSPRIAFFGSDPTLDSLKEAANNNLPVIVEVDKFDYYKALKVRIIQ